MDQNREKLGSRLGFILLSAGCAIGCGNVWKFPWMTGAYGGGGFVLVLSIMSGSAGTSCPDDGICNRQSLSGQPGQNVSEA